jgi:hypothetical protein
MQDAGAVAYLHKSAASSQLVSVMRAWYTRVREQLPPAPVAGPRSGISPHVARMPGHVDSGPFPLAHQALDDDHASLQRWSERRMPCV